ncbi:MAG: hypothetical protein II918_02755 [Firmicutes bacterium]|nr:hypothetical protein [Bacillota bacterium]
MKLKTWIFFIALILIASGAVYANTVVNQISHDISITSENIYGDQAVMDGVSIGLSYEAESSLRWDSNIRYDAKNIATDTELTKGNFNTWENVVSAIGMEPTGEYTNDQLVENFIRDTYCKEAGGKYADGRGYFYIKGEAVYPADYLEDYGEYPTPQGELPDINAVFTMDYDIYEGTDFITRPLKDSIRPITEFEEGCEIMDLGLSKDAKCLEVIYKKSDDVRIRIVDAASGEMIYDDRIGLSDDEFNVLFPEDMEESAEDAVIVFSDKGFTLVAEEAGKYAKVIEKSFDSNDGPETLGRWYEANPYRFKKTFFDGDKLVFAYRIAATDPIYENYKGTAVIAYERDGLKYIGTIGSELNDIKGVKALDFYAVDYELGQFVGVDIDVLSKDTTVGKEYVASKEYREVADRLEEVQLAEDKKYPMNNLYVNSGDGYYTVEYIRMGD